MSRIRGKAPTVPRQSSGTTMGIDVSKRWLDAAVHPAGDQIRVRNDSSGFEQIQKLGTAVGADLVVIEATGRYHREAHASLHAAGFRVAVVNPYRSRRFADVMGQSAKSDRIDAVTLATFGATMKPAPSEQPSELMVELAEISVARRQIVDERVALEQQHGEAILGTVKAQIADRIALCKRQCKDLEAALLNRVRSDRHVARRFRVLTSIPEIGPVTAATLLVEMKELGHANGAQVAALAGVAPMNRDSGNLRGRMTIKAGRAAVRRSLYMAAVVAIRWNKDFKSFYGPIPLKNSARRPRCFRPDVCDACA